MPFSESPEELSRNGLGDSSAFFVASLQVLFSRLGFSDFLFGIFIFHHAVSAGEAFCHALSQSFEGADRHSPAVGFRGCFFAFPLYTCFRMAGDSSLD